MRKLLLILVLQFSFCSLNSFAQTRLSDGQVYGWYVIDPVSITGTPNFSDVFFTDDNTGWIVNAGTVTSFWEIHRTTDGVTSFSSHPMPPGYTSTIHMLDTSNGYKGGSGCYKSSDGGLNWNIIYSGFLVLDISFPPGTSVFNPIGYACGSYGRVWKITSTLSEIFSGGPFQNFMGISAPSIDNVWVCGDTTVYYYNGNYFDQQLGGGIFTDIHFVNNQEGWVVGSYGDIKHTTDGGSSWITQTNPDPDNRTLTKVFFLNSDIGWAVGHLGRILHTIDGGSTWVLEGEGLTIEWLNGIYFTSPTNGYVVGDNKTLLKFGEITSVENEEELPSEFSLSQNYPNPFNPSTKISWQSAASSWQTLKVYDILGNEVATLVNEYKPAGSYEINFEGNGLTSGIYFYQLRAGSFIQTKKMILIK